MSVDLRMGLINKIETSHIQIFFITNPRMNYIEDARQQVRRYEQRLEQTKDALQLYTELIDNAVLYTWTKAQLKEQEISYAKSLKSAQDLLARIHLYTWTKAQLKEEEISYTKSLKLAQESLARIEQSRRERLNEMTPEEKKKEYDTMCAEREKAKMDYILMYGFDAWEKK